MTFFFDNTFPPQLMKNWRAAHRAFFEREAANHGLAFTEDLEVVLHRFELVFGGGRPDRR